jgi:hypothetical protein
VQGARPRMTFSLRISESLYILASMFGVSPVTIHLARRNRTLRDR